jgi:hypothetical protein
VAFEVSRKRRSARVLAGDDVVEAGTPRPPIIAFPIDSFADASLARERDEAGRRELRCDACDRKIEGEAEGRGLFLSTRGAEVRFDEPALCATCATAIGVRAQLAAEIEEEEG